MPFDQKTINLRKQQAIEDEAQYRACRLSPPEVARWTKAVSMSVKYVREGPKPCSYWSWMGALHEFSRDPPFVGKPPKYVSQTHGGLMAFAEDLAQPRWPDPRADLIEFALLFLEADVMLHGSGYAKRHLIHRLRQSPLSEDHIARINLLLRRAVVNGTGVEEFRAYCRIASHLVAQGELTALPDWLAGLAPGAIAANEKSNQLINDLFQKDLLSEADYSKLIFGVNGLGQSHSIAPHVLPARQLQKSSYQQIRRNAYWILKAINARQEMVT